MKIVRLFTLLTVVTVLGCSVSADSRLSARERLQQLPQFQADLARYQSSPGAKALAGLIVEENNGRYGAVWAFAVARESQELANSSALYVCNLTAQRRGASQENCQLWYQGAAQLTQSPNP